MIQEGTTTIALDRSVKARLEGLKPFESVSNGDTVEYLVNHHEATAQKEEEVRDLE